MINEKLFEAVLPPIPVPSSEDLPTEDGIPLETPWHRAEINLLLESLDYYWRDRQDYYAGGNMFLYFSSQQIRNQDYRGPDFFVVKDVDGSYERLSWVVWEEGGRYPDVIIELLSPSTAETDKTTKKQLYERVFRTAEYFCYDPSNQELIGWHLQQNQYEQLEPDEYGRLWSSVLQVWLGAWDGRFISRHATWLRFYDEDGLLVPITAEAEAARASREAAARQTAEAEVTRLREELARLQGNAP
ncbi:MAG TPA: Uma2 family endonuclease [Chloroflexota bacterium]|nr:Uma2 family endonuclease [Chloroflexota bacterium]